MPPRSMSRRVSCAGHVSAAAARRWLPGLQRLPQPLRGCYEAGPTGFALYRAAAAAGLRVDVIAPSKTPRAPGDRIKSDRKDAELLARLLARRPAEGRHGAQPRAFEAARHLCRAREQVRGDLMRCRHRVSKLLLLHGRVYPEPSTWTQTSPPLACPAAVRRARQRARLPRHARRRRRPGRPQSRARRAALAARAGGRVVADRRSAALLPRHRHADRARALPRDRRLRPLPAPAQAQRPGSDSCPLSTSPARAAARARSPRPAPATRAACSSRPPGTTCASRESAPASPTASTASPPRPPDRLARPAPPAPPPHPPARTRQARQRHHRRRRPRTRLLPLGRRHGRLTPTDSRLLGRAPGRSAAGTRD